MIRPTFLSFETAKRAITIGQLGLDTVGHNIANAQTPGYTRQRVDQISLNSAGYQTKYNNFGVQFPGQGADIRAITQIRDPYLDNRYRLEATSFGELGIKQSGLVDINNILDEIQTNGLHAKMGDLYTAIDKLLAQADSKELAMVVRNTAHELMQILNQNAKDFAVAREQQTKDLKTTVDAEVNDLLAKIADLNVRIKQDHFYGNPSNELVDQRNVLIDKLSEYLDIQVVRTPVQIAGDLTIEKLSIELRDSGKPPQVLVDSGSFNKLEVREDANGFVSIHLIDGISGFPVNARGINLSTATEAQRDDMGNITGNLYRGGIKGFLDIINGVGPNSNAAGNNTFKGIPYYQASLDEYAAKLAEAFNRVNNVTEQESAASGGLHSPTTDKNLFVPNSLTILGQPEPPWIESITPGFLEFSGRNYGMAFTTIPAVAPGTSGPDDPGSPAMVQAVIDGKTYTAEFIEGQKLEFREVLENGEFGAVAFSVMPVKQADGSPLPFASIPSGTSAIIDARITASNITISQSWFSDPLYMLASKLPASTKSDPKLDIAGNPPAWVRSITFTPNKDDPDALQQIPDGRYLFREIPLAGNPNPGATGPAVAVDIYDPATDTTKTYIAVSPPEYPWPRNTGVNFYEASAFPLPTAPDPVPPPVFTITTSANANTVAPGAASGSSPTLIRLDTDATKNILSLKNVTAAASDNIFKFKELFTETSTFSNAGYSGTFEGFLINMQSEASLDHKLNTSKLDASFIVISSLADRRDAVSAVSIDEEGISMMQYQNFYNAAARYMTTLDEALDRIINGMGIVGR